MKKIYLVLFVIVFNYSYSQSYSIEIGVNQSWVSYKESPDRFPFNDPKSNFNIAFFKILELTSNLTSKIGLGYKSYGDEYTPNIDYLNDWGVVFHYDWKMYNLYIPLNVKYYLFNNNIYVFGGGNVSYILGESKFNEKSYDINRLKRLHFSINSGFGYEFSVLEQDLYLQVDYEYFITEVNEHTQDRWNIESWNICLGYSF